MLGRIAWILVLCAAAGATPATAAPSTAIVWEREGTGAFDFAGTAVGTAGDVNCDGIADLIVGMPKDDEATCPSCGSADSGTIAVWFGSKTLPPQPDPFAAPDWYTYTGSFDGNLGSAVAAGDVNGDGCDDVIASEPFPGFALISPQKVHVFLGPLPAISQPPDSRVAPPDLPDWSAVLFQRTAPETGGQQPVSVAAGDVNGDGIADVIVGQPEASNGQNEEGVVMVWLGSQNFANEPDGTTANVDWMAQSDQAGAHLGESVAAAMDANGDGRSDILAGAPDFNGVGWAFLWLGSPVLESAADGTPANKAWSLTIGAAGSRLGASVGAAGDFNGDGFGDMIVGAPLHDAWNTYVDSGEALLVLGGNPLPATDIFSFYFGPGTAGGQLGTAVGTAGDVNGDGLGDILVGEPDLGATTTQAGRVHLILGRKGYNGFLTQGPPADAIYTAPNTINNVGDKARFGAAVGTAGDWNGDGFSDVIVGAPRFGQSLWGKVFVFLGRGETLSTTSYPATGIQADSANGLGVAFAGDINHDGFSDFVTGAPNYESEAGQSAEGRIFVHYGTACGPSYACGGPFELLLPGERESNQPGANLGWSLSGAGDVNGDGYADVIAGAPSFDLEFICGFRPLTFCPSPNAGIVQIFMGSASGLALTPSLSFDSSGGFLGSAGPAEAQFGFAVAGAGDVNGDGYGDVLVGAPYESSGPASDGRVRLYLGSATGIDATPVWTKAGGQANARFGIALAGAGDVNRDGYSDVIIGADGYGGTGAAFVYLGQPGGLKPNPVRTYLGSASSSFGLSVNTAGDINRDGYADVVVGAPTTQYSAFQHWGQVTVYFGSASGPSASPSATLTGDPPPFVDSNRFGSGVAGAGDVNGDGYGDLIVGDQWHTGAWGFAQGKAYLYHGGPGGLTPARNFEDCAGSFCDFGRDVAGGHDVNGDGFSDVLIAAYGSDLGASNGGDVFLHMGNEDRGSALAPLQAAGFASSPRALLGILPDFVEASLRLHSPAGRSRVQMELEIEPLGQDFDGLGTTRGLFFDNGIIARDLLYESRPSGGVYHWRARLRSASPLFGRSRWVSLPGNAPREADFRVFSDNDGDGVNQAADVCPFYAQTSNADSDGDARGNQCECGDQNGDGLNTVADLVAINSAIFNPGLITPLCDANNDGQCNVSDIVAVNVEIFSPGSTSICARQPVPQP